MIEPSFATLIMLVIGLLLLFVIPLLDASKKFGKFISLRYTLIVITTIMAIGCVLDFSHLNESSRNIALAGGLSLIGLFVIVRSLEKCKLGPRKFHITAKKGDIELNAEIEHNKESKDGDKDSEKEK